MGSSVVRPCVSIIVDVDVVAATATCLVSVIFVQEQIERIDDVARIQRPDVCFGSDTRRHQRCCIEVEKVIAFVRHRR